MPKERLVASDANRVTIYVWLRRISAGQVGHVALRTYVGGPVNQGIYASFWPSAFHKAQLSLSGVGGAHVTYQMDTNAEGREPDVIVHLYSLAVDRINEAYVQFVQQGYNWSLWGCTLFRSENTRNCSGLVNHLLEVGGVTQLVATYTQRMTAAGRTINEITNEVVAGVSFLSSIPTWGTFLYYGVTWGYRLALGPAGSVVVGFVAHIAGTLVAMIPMKIGIEMRRDTIDAARAGIAVAHVIDESIVTPNHIAALMQYGLAAEREQYEIVFPSSAHELPHTVPRVPGKKCVIS